MLLINNFHALGTSCFLEIFDDLDQKNFNLIMEYLILEIINFENNFSRFKENSLIGQLNKNKKLNYNSEDLFKMLSISQDMNLITNGIFNIAIAQILESNGYGGNYLEGNKFFPEQKDVLKFDSSSVEIASNIKIDLGGIGKGYLIEKISLILKNKFHLKYFLINFGGDIYATTDRGNKIKIDLENPNIPGMKIGSIFLTNNSVCCSSNSKRNWTIQDKTFYHILDPESKKVNFSSFVISTSTTIGDIVATCLCIDPNISENFNNIGFLIVDEFGQVVKMR